MKVQLNDWRILYRHFSSWAFYLVLVVEAARAQDIDLSFLPQRVVAIIALLGLAAKIYKQEKARREVASLNSDPSYGESLDEARK